MRTEDDCGHCGDEICVAILDFEVDGLVVLSCSSDVRENSHGVESVFASVILREPNGETWPAKAIDALKARIAQAARDSDCDLPVYVQLMSAPKVSLTEA